MRRTLRGIHSHCCVKLNIFSFQGVFWLENTRTATLMGKDMEKGELWVLPSLKWLIQNFISHWFENNSQEISCFSSLFDAVWFSAIRIWILLYPPIIPCPFFSSCCSFFALHQWSSFYSKAEVSSVDATIKVVNSPSQKVEEMPLGLCCFGFQWKKWILQDV